MYSDNDNSRTIWAVACVLILIILSISTFSKHTSFAKKNLRLISPGTIIKGDELFKILKPWNNDLHKQNDSVVIYNNSFYQFKLRSGRSTRIPVYIIARGKPAAGIAPWLNFKIYPNNQQGAFITSRDWGLYKLDLDIPKGKCLFEMSYFNDAFKYPDDKNIELKMLGFGKLPVDWKNYVRFKAPCPINPTDMAIQKWCGSDTDVFILWNNAELADDIYFDQDGDHTLHAQVLARRKTQEQPRLIFSINDKEVANKTVRSSSPEMITIPFSAASGLNRLRIRNISNSRTRHVDNDVVLTGLWIDIAPREAPINKQAIILRDKPQICRFNDFDNYSGGSNIGDEWALWSNGYVKKKLYSTKPQTWYITLNARADLCEGDGPRVVVLVDKHPVAALNITETNSCRETTWFRFEEGMHDLILVYDNDKYTSDDQDMNLYIKDVTFSRK